MCSLEHDSSWLLILVVPRGEAEFLKLQLRVGQDAHELKEDLFR
jgi:hypothetical protein